LYIKQRDGEDIITAGQSSLLTAPPSKPAQQYVKVLLLVTRSLIGPAIATG